MPTAANTSPPEPNDVDGPADPPEPRWPAVVAAATVVLLYLALPAELAVGPRWLFPVLIAGLVVWTSVAHQQERPGLNHGISLVNSGLMTGFVIFSLALLVRAMVHGTERPATMLWSAGALWSANVLTFALWFWRLDAGGPNGRDRRPGHDRGAFLFPQMTDPELARSPAGVVPPVAWSPQFVDYLFVAFNTATAFSPTDTAVLDRWAKVLSMTESAISLTVVAVLLARGVGGL